MKPEAPKLRVVKPPIIPIFWRTLSLLCALLLCAFAACCWWAKGISWVYDVYSSNIPVLSCPSKIYSFQSIVPDGDFCQVSLAEYMNNLSTFSDNNLFGTNKFSCSRPVDTSEPIICNLDRRCDVSMCHFESDISKPCRDFSREPPIPVGITGPICNSLVGFNPVSLGPVWISVPCKNLLIGSYCDSEFNVTSSNAIAIRGLLVGAVLVTLIWFIAEWVLRSVDIDLRIEKATGLARMAIELPVKKKILRKSLEDRWRQATASAPPNPTHINDDDGCIWTPKSFSPLGDDHLHSNDYSVTNDPSRRFHSVQWRRHLDQWKKLRKEKTGAFRTKFFLRSLLLNLFFIALLVGTYYVIILISPQNISVDETWYESVVGKMKIWNLTNWVDYLIFADIFLDTGIFLIACIAVKWPKAPVFSKHLQNQIAEAALDKSDEMDDVVSPWNDAVTEDPPVGTKRLTLDSHGDEDFDFSLGGEAPESQLSFILNQRVSIDTCLMIACHCSTMTVERCKTFSNTLKSALAVFPPSHIFVCDNGPTIHPQDATQFVAKQVDPDINYVYIPEGNKTFAFYWCNKYWIPFLAKCGVVPNFTYALIIDDDVPLPADLHIPHEHLRQDTRIKAVHFPITATTPDGNPPLLVKCQDVEYKLAAVHKQFQATMYRSLSCHGAIALWERTTMGEVFHGHDTVFNGEDLYMGITLLRKRDDSKIISSAQTIVPTYAPDNFPVLFRQRVKSWELTSHKKTFTYLIEILNPVSFFHLPSLCLKPYFMQELLTILLDWLRIFLICGLLLRDTLGLILMTVFFSFLLYIQLLLFQFVILRERKDLRSSFYTILMFPLYKFMSLLFRICALCQNILVYSKERKNLPIKIREDEIRDIPPLPPHHLVDWFTVWEGEANVPLYYSRPPPLSFHEGSALQIRHQTHRTDLNGMYVVCLGRDGMRTLVMNNSGETLSISDTHLQHTEIVAGSTRVTLVGLGDKQPIYNGRTGIADSYADGLWTIELEPTKAEINLCLPQSDSFACVVVKPMNMVITPAAATISGSDEFTTVPLSMDNKARPSPSVLGASVVMDNRQPVLKRCAVLRKLVHELPGFAQLVVCVVVKLHSSHLILDPADVDDATYMANMFTDGKLDDGIPTRNLDELVVAGLVSIKQLLRIADRYANHLVFAIDTNFACVRDTIATMIGTDTRKPMHK